MRTSHTLSVFVSPSFLCNNEQNPLISLISAEGLPVRTIVPVTIPRKSLQYRRTKRWCLYYFLDDTLEDEETIQLVKQ